MDGSETDRSDEDNEVSSRLLSATSDEIDDVTAILDYKINLLNTHLANLAHEQTDLMLAISKNDEKITAAKSFPCVVGYILEVLDEDPNDPSLKCPSVIVNTSDKKTVFVSQSTFVDVSKLRIGDLVCMNRDTYQLIQVLPPEFDTRLLSMQVEERPTDEFINLAGVEKQILELVEATTLPLTHSHVFEALGVQPPRGVLLYGPPGNGKTLAARACANYTNANFVKLTGSQLAQMYLGEGAQLVREIFASAREKAPSIIFIDDIDAIARKRGINEHCKETERTLIQLLTELDKLTEKDKVKVIAATSRIDLIDTALLRSGRFDRKVEFPMPDEDARLRILQVHSRKLYVGQSVDFAVLAKLTTDFSAAHLKHVCIEAGLNALRRDRLEVEQEDFLVGIAEVQGNKKVITYYA